MFYHLFYLLLHHHTVAVQWKSELLTTAWPDAISPIDGINIQDTQKTIKGQISWKSVAEFWVYLTVPWFSTCCCHNTQSTLKISHQSQLNCYSFQNLVFISTSSSQPAHLQETHYKYKILGKILATQNSIKRNMISCIHIGY